MQKAAIATIELNERSGKAEVVHRFSQHDAEHVAHLFSEDKKSIILSDDVRGKFADYVVNGFSLADLSGKAIELETVGHEFDRGYIWIYQEFDMPEDVHGLRIGYSALQEIWPSQTNTVNIELDGRVKTLSFSGNITMRTLRFDDRKNDSHSHKGSTHSHSH